jgi:hypothetical protein
VPVFVPAPAPISNTMFVGGTAPTAPVAVGPGYTTGGTIYVGGAPSAPVPVAPDYIAGSDQIIVGGSKPPGIAALPPELFEIVQGSHNHAIQNAIG